MSETTTVENAGGSEDLAGLLAQMREADEAPAPETTAPAAVEPEAPAEAETAPEPEDDKEKRRRGLVGDLQDERERRRAAQAEIERLRQERAQMTELLQRVMPKAPEEPKTPDIPSVDVDPVAHFKAVAEQQDARLRQIEQERQQNAQQAQFMNAYRAAVSQFTAEAPDFGAAYEHAIKSLQQDAAIFGMPADVAEARIVATAFESGKNPAQALYEFAKARGYSKPSAQAKADPIETLQRGTNAARGVAAAAGNSPRGGLDMAAIAAMTPDQFSREYAKNPDAILRVLRGDG